MCGWRPKTSATGGLPNITFEPRKPKSLGTMVRNGAECISGIMTHHDIVQAHGDQAKKEYTNEISHLPRGEVIHQHVAETLRQAKGARVKRGGWVGGDAWFGSINSCVELKRRLGINSSFIVKGNTNYYPMSIACNPHKTQNMYCSTYFFRKYFRTSKTL